RDDVIELSPVWPDLLDAAGHQPEIFQSELPGHGLPIGDRLRREVDADEAAARKRGRHRNEVVAISATELEDPAGVNRRGGHAEQRGESRETIRVGLMPGVTGIANFVV